MSSRYVFPDLDCLKSSYEKSEKVDFDILSKVSSVNLEQDAISDLDEHELNQVSLPEEDENHHDLFRNLEAFMRKFSVTDTDKEFLFEINKKILIALLEILYVKLPKDFSAFFTKIWEDVSEIYDNCQLDFLVSKEEFAEYKKIFDNLKRKNLHKDKINLKLDKDLSRGQIRVTADNLSVDSDVAHAYKNAVEFLEGM